MTILRKRIIFQHKDYPRGKTLPNLYAKFLFRVSVLPFYQNTCGVRSRNTSQGFVIIIEFTHFASFYNFNTNGDDFRNKEVIQGVKVRVGI